MNYKTKPLMISSWPQTILHLDADAFFASCEQAVHPEWRGLPVITGQERGIVAAASYEAKRAGVDRGTPLWQVKKICPNAIIVPSDYETYSLFSTRLFEIMKRFTPDVEEYSIDEAFADLTGLCRPMHASYEQIAKQIKETAERELGIGVSVGVAPSKTLAKIASKWDKPSGLTIVPGRRIHEYLSKLPVGKVWGIGSQTEAWCHKLRIRTALDFATKDEGFIAKNFTKPYQETWAELNGHQIYPIATDAKTKYASISKTKTFTPPSGDRHFVFAQLMKNLENACIKARRHSLTASKVGIFLKTQGYDYVGAEIKLSEPSAFPLELSENISEEFLKMFRPNLVYRATGVVLSGLTENKDYQMDLFKRTADNDKLRKLYAAVDALSDKMGKHAIRIASTASAHTSNNLANRSKKPLRKMNRLPGESDRKHLAVPVLNYRLT